MSAAAPSAQLAAFSPRVRIRRSVSVAFMVMALLAIAISMIMLGALIVEIALDGAARLFTDGAAVTRESRGGGIISDLPTPQGMGWLAWGLPVAILLPFVGPRLINALIPDLPQLVERAIGLIVVAPAAVFVHILYVRFESAYFIEYARSVDINGASGNIIQLFGEASGFQFVRLLIIGLGVPLAILALGWLWSKRMRKPTLIIPAIMIAAWVVYLFIDPWFLSSFPSRTPAEAGIFSAVTGTLYMMVITAAIAFPIGVGAAIYLEEYARRNWFSRMIQVNISNLAGVPSIIYGLLGLQVFVRVLEFERSVLAGACTMALLVMPIIIVSAQEALRTVPPSMREAAYAVGATRWQVIRYHVLPYAFGGMLTGNILAMSRAIGETAPLIAIGALTFIAFLADSPTDDFTVLPIQIFNWVARPQAGFHEIAASAIIVLMVILLLMNTAAIIMRQRTRTDW
jgi:phosphate transport system permease protein